jgi:predicted nucleotidyltransferase
VTIEAVLDAMDASGVAYALIGAAARNAWAPPRATTDLDVAALVDAPGYERVVRALAAIGYAPSRVHRAEPSDPVPAVTIFRNEEEERPYRQVDVLAAFTPFEQEAVTLAVERRFGRRRVRVVRREHLIVYKLIAWRDRDRQDVTDVIATARVAGAEVDFDLIRYWAREWEVEARLAQALAGGEI